MKRQHSFHRPRQFAENTSLLIAGIRSRFRRRINLRSQGLAFALLGALLCAGGSARAQSGMSLPVYHVTQPGATATQATQLAADLGIPTSQLVYSNGLVSYIDPDQFLNVPTMPVTDQNAISNLLADTVNQSPDIPIHFEQIDFGALSNRTVLDDVDAEDMAGFALSDSMLGPQFGTSRVSHAMLQTYLNIPGGVSSNSQPLDTQVNYQFQDTNGYPFVGPGAQVQFAFNGTGNTTRLLYAARRLTPGPLVEIIPQAVALSRVANLFPAGTQLSADIEYYCPPFWWHWPFPCPCPPPPWQVQNILPYWVIRGSVPQTDPIDGQVVQMHTLTEMIPATDDPAFVPTVNLSASAGAAGGVFASVDVAGGTPPYVYEWGGSASTLPTSNAPAFSYNPVVRVVQPELQVSRPAGSVAIVSWTDTASGPHPWPWILESSVNLNGGSNNWTMVTSPVQLNRGVSSVTLSNVPAVQFYRLRLASTSLTSTDVVSVTVIDANGVSVHASQNLVVQATAVQLVPGSSGFPPSGPCQPQWGTESPVDPGLGTKDRTDWRARMMADPGTGTESFLWTINTAWLGDFLDPVVPHKLGLNPEISGCDDYKNWGVDGADITLYIGHGAPPVFTFTATPALWYNDPKLTRSWGDDADVGYHPADWLCLLSCEVLSNNWGGLTAAQRWGGAFDGLHIMTGFQSLAWAGTGFPATFADNMMLGASQTIVKSWINSAMMHGTGQAAALGPIGFGGAIDYNDHYWCKGNVGPTIKPPLIIGWWFVSM